jgi:hypothetical protein
MRERRWLSELDRTGRLIISGLIVEYDETKQPWTWSDRSGLYPGDRYVAERNTGAHLLTVREVSDNGYVVPEEHAYCYDCSECIPVRIVGRAPQADRDLTQEETDAILARYEQLDNDHFPNRLLVNLVTLEFQIDEDRLMDILTTSTAPGGV